MSNPPLSHLAKNVTLGPQWHPWLFGSLTLILVEHLYGSRESTKSSGLFGVRRGPAWVSFDSAGDRPSSVDFLFVILVTLSP